MLSDDIKKMSMDIVSHKSDKYELADKNYEATGYYFLNTPFGVEKNKSKDRLLEMAKDVVDNKLYGSERWVEQGFTRHDLEEDMGNLIFWVENENYPEGGTFIKRDGALEELSNRDLGYILEDVPDEPSILENLDDEPNIEDLDLD